MNLPAVFHFNHGDSPLHRADARAKTAAFIAVNFAILLSGAAGLLVIFPILSVGYVVGKQSILRPLREGWLLMVLIAMVVLSRLLSHDASGITFSARMVLALLAAHLYSSTTSLRDVRHVLHWFLRPFAPRAAARLSSMMMLTMAFVPIFFDCAGQVGDGLAARGLLARRSPLRYVRFLAIGMLQTIAARAAHLSSALESRAFRIESDPPDFSGRQEAALPAAGVRTMPSFLCIAAAVFMVVVTIAS